MAKGFILKNNLTKDTLLKLALIGAFTINAFTSPYFLHSVIEKYFKEKNKDMIRKRVRKLRELQKKKLIQFQELPDGSVKITLSHLGKNLVRQYNIENIKIQKPNRWDKQWRMLIYDIPITKRKASDAFRNKIKQLGMYQIQKSIWVYPYDCMAEIEFLCAIFEIDINNTIYLFKTKTIPKEKEVRNFFKL